MQEFGRHQKVSEAPCATESKISLKCRSLVVPFIAGDIRVADLGVRRGVLLSCCSSTCEFESSCEKNEEEVKDSLKRRVLRGDISTNGIIQYSTQNVAVHAMAFEFESTLHGCGRRRLPMPRCS